MTEWNIQPRSRTCGKCGAPFADKAIYHALLFFGSEGYRRLDLCGACFDAPTRELAACYWQGEYKAPPSPAPEPIRRDVAEELLRRLMQSNETQMAAARYILAVMLERKRLLKHQDTVRKDDGTEWLAYEHTKTGESFLILDPKLRLDQLDEVREQVTQLLAPSGAEIDTVSGGR
ncbi:MAG: hypothetical protein NZ483_03150 [Verrucomicrobiae bacterium]|nr:hypothetical protein [Verrucomicrobiae bacterium]